MGGQIDAIVSLLVALIMVVGAGFSLLAALGIIRFPDLYTRMHSASKAGTVGSGLLLFAAGVHSLDPAILARALAAFVFFVLTAPISAHLLAKAAHQAGYRMSRLSVIDQMPEKEEARGQ
ncbi:Na(+) H(+) antiporter subunit G [Sinorhizobium sojae CCBAU 05684]|uniref:Na(+) H(+) antiporter subunit G n=2 Tax=Sinorhizobium TaxID=28105 RepID=A0A249P835_9HYPH|nr:monovalent cation/H(+) antiporter subunit G [Sinorhizobium sojae]AAR91688.1 putative cation efflux system protein [Sinorhizobium fredii]ASY62088.1 Na(+) H(+) antiporter subunit G [Sinorhizobium sojae CCBAU 05684]